MRPRAATSILAAAILAAVPMLAAGCKERPGSSLGGIVDERIVRQQVRPGDGPPVVPGRLVEVHYKRFAPDGRVIVDTRARGKPHDWIVGDRSTFIGLDRAIRGLPEGSIWNITIPADLHQSYTSADRLTPAAPGRPAPPRSSAPATYRIEIIRVADPPAVADASDRVLPFVAPRRSGHARPSHFPLVNATRGWRD